MSASPVMGLLHDRINVPSTGGVDLAGNQHSMHNGASPTACKSQQRVILALQDKIDGLQAHIRSYTHVQLASDLGSRCAPPVAPPLSVAPSAFTVWRTSATDERLATKQRSSWSEIGNYAVCSACAPACLALSTVATSFQWFSCWNFAHIICSRTPNAAALTSSLSEHLQECSEAESKMRLAGKVDSLHAQCNLLRIMHSWHDLTKKAKACLRAWADFWRSRLTRVLHCWQRLCMCSRMRVRLETQHACRVMETALQVCPCALLATHTLRQHAACQLVLHAACKTGLSCWLCIPWSAGNALMGFMQSCSHPN